MSLSPSFPSRWDGCHLNMFWIPAFAGMTEQGTFYEFIMYWENKGSGNPDLFVFVQLWIFLVEQDGIANNLDKAAFTANRENLCRFLFGSRAAFTYLDLDQLVTAQLKFCGCNYFFT